VISPILSNLFLHYRAPGQTWHFQRVKLPLRQGVEPPHRKSSLEPEEVTNRVKRRQSDKRAVTKVKRMSLVKYSYGLRPARNPHHALRALRLQIVTKKVMQVFEADIRSYFTKINREWLRKMVAHRIADPVILSLIGKWLNAGAMQDGVVIHSDEGTPQGGPISPILSNIYLHFLLDLWFEKKIKPGCRGEAYLVRFADDCAPRRREEEVRM
jgi:retron-type reverse transcriptase